MQKNKFLLLKNIVKVIFIVKFEIKNCENKIVKNVFCVNLDIKEFIISVNINESINEIFDLKNKINVEFKIVFLKFGLDKMLLQLLKLQLYLVLLCMLIGVFSDFIKVCKIGIKVKININISKGKSINVILEIV